MRTLRIFIVVVFTIMASMVNAQSLTKDVIVSGAIQVGGNYWDLLGIHATENIALYTTVMAQHKSGFGVAYFAYDDFSKEEMGRIRFFDALYTHAWENVSLYSAFEYVYYDNWHDGECVMPYAIVTLTSGTWAYEVAPMLTYFPHFSEDNYEFTCYAKVKKNIFKDIDLHATVWYDNIYKDHFYGAIGAQLSLPKDFYIGCNALYKDDEFVPFVSLGWRFTTDK